jgi:hypothetical protein
VLPKRCWLEDVFPETGYPETLVYRNGFLPLEVPGFKPKQKDNKSLPVSVPARPTFCFVCCLHVCVGRARVLFAMALASPKLLHRFEGFVLLQTIVEVGFSIRVALSICAVPP